MTEETETQPLIKVARLMASGGEKAANLALDEPAMENKTFKELVDHLINTANNPQDKIVAEGLKAEIQGSYGVTVNGQTVDPTEKVGDYLTRMTSRENVDYLGAKIVVAAKQEGGLDYLL